MKNYNRLFILLIILVIWNVLLTTVLVKNVNKEENLPNVNQTIVTGFSTDLTEVTKEAKSSVVVIETNNALSSGIIYKTKDNSIYVVTTYHGVDNASVINVVLASGASFEANLIGKDIFADIAVLEIKNNIEVMPVKLGNSELIKDGEFLTCIGTPKNIQYTYSTDLAIVSSNLRTITNSITFEDEQYEFYANVIQLSSNVEEGYSGSPVLNMAGEVVGLITMKDNNVVFALPINEVKIVADNIINNVEYVKRQFGYKGQFVTNLEAYEKNQLNIPLDINYGLYINNVRINTIASEMGLKIGDILLSINGNKINSYNDLLLIEYQDEKTYNFEVERNNETITLVGSIND